MSINNANKKYQLKCLSVPSYYIRLVVAHLVLCILVVVDILAGFVSSAYFTLSAFCLPVADILQV